MKILESKLIFGNCCSRLTQLLEGISTIRFVVGCTKGEQVRSGWSTGNSAWSGYGT